MFGVGEMFKNFNANLTLRFLHFLFYLDIRSAISEVKKGAGWLICLFSPLFFFLGGDKISSEVILAFRFLTF
jgi:hypothetical protein